MRTSKSKRLFLALSLIAAALTLFIPCKNLANVGVFGGYGYDVKLLKNEDIQMLGEDIIIVPERGPELFDGGTAGMDRVRYFCTFKLKNLRKNTVTIQVGFPLDSHFMSGVLRQPKPLLHAMELYSFIAHDGEKTYSVRYQREDKAQKFRAIFLWDMTFESLEEKTLHVTYTMPMSMTLASTNKDDGRDSHKTTPEWFPILEMSMVEGLGYVTSTGASWAGGTIGNAKFTLRLGAFDRYLKNRPLEEDPPNKDKLLERIPSWEPACFLTLIPADGWEPSGKGDLARTLKNYNPAEDIHVAYYITIFPRTAEDTNRFVAHIRKRAGENGGSFASTPQTMQSDFDALRDILREFNGTHTKNASIQEYIKQQKWYGLTPMQPIPEIVFQTLEQLRNQTVRQ